jgi:hypothetical protein
MLRRALLVCGIYMRPSFDLEPRPNYATSGSTVVLRSAVRVCLRNARTRASTMPCWLQHMS